MTETTHRGRLEKGQTAIAEKTRRRMALLEERVAGRNTPAIDNELTSLDGELLELRRDEEGLQLALERADDQAAADEAARRTEAKATFFQELGTGWSDFDAKYAAEGETLAVLDAACRLASWSADGLVAFPEHTRLKADQLKCGRLIASLRRTLQISPMAGASPAIDRPWRALLAVAVPGYGQPQEPAFFDAAKFDAPADRAFTAD